MTSTEILAAAFVVMAPIVAGAARFTIRIYRRDPSGVGLALALATTGGAVLAAFVGLVSFAYLVGATTLTEILAPGVVPAFLGFEILLTLVPLYLRRLNGRKGG